MTQRSGSRATPEQQTLHVEIFDPELAQEPQLSLILCHGFGGSARKFRPQARAFRESMRVVLYDARGHARSRMADVGGAATAFDLPALVSDLGWVISNHARGTVVLGGLSMGAATALAYAVKHPERIGGLLLAAYPNSSARFRDWALGLAQAIESEGLSRAFELYVAKDSARFDAKSRDLIRQGFLEHSESALVALLRDCLALLPEVETLAPSLRAMSMPTRIVVGSADAASFEPCRLLSRLIPRASLSVLAEAGHVVNLERVSEFNEELAKLISEVNC